jgi:hypothetical protein
MHHSTAHVKLASQHLIRQGREEPKRRKQKLSFSNGSFGLIERTYIGQKRLCYGDKQI